MECFQKKPLYSGISLEKSTTRTVMTLNKCFYDIPDRNIGLSMVTSRLAGTGCQKVSTYSPVILTLVCILPNHLNKGASQN